MEFSEGQTPWQNVPDWVSYLIDLGYLWLCQSHDSRMIVVVSMPSTSAGAGLVTLGAMRKCLELEEANDTSSHYEKLLRLARTRSVGVELRHPSWKGRFVFDGIDQEGNPCVRKLNVDDNMRVNITRSSALRWKIHGEAPVVLGNGEQIPNRQIYAHLVNHGGSIRSSNLSESYSHVCLAGQGVGEAPTKASMAQVRFRHSGDEADLAQLLTVQSWLPRTISRTLFYNSRTEQFDRNTGRPSTVIADGDTSFLKVLDAEVFEDSDVIGVFHRTLERDRLETIGTKLENLRQWYDQAIVADLPEPPRGIATYILKRR